MARISGINIPTNKRIVIALTYVKGIGKTTSEKIIKQSGLNPDTRTKDLSDTEVDKLRIIIEKSYVTEGELSRRVASNIRRLKEIKSYRGSRHINKLPSRGQRTKTNSRTNRGGKRTTVGSGRKASGQKT